MAHQPNRPPVAHHRTRPVAAGLDADLARPTQRPPAMPPHPTRPPAPHHRTPPVAAGLDADLARRTRAGDREAFGELYRLTVDLVTRYIAVRMRDRDRDAIDDLVHDAY